jgi:hypothetical protein
MNYKVPLFIVLLVVLNGSLANAQVDRESGIVVHRPIGAEIVCVNGYFGGLWHRTLIILSNCPRRAKNVSERARCRSQLQLRDRKRDHNDNQRVHST